MIKNNGLSGKNISLLNKNGQIQVSKEKNNNWENVQKIFGLLNQRFFRMPHLLSETAIRYTYEYIAGYTYSKVKAMSLSQIYQILDFILEYQNLFQNERGEVIVHGDISPVNVVFDEKTKLPLKIIDWDGAYFGNKYDDVAYVCWLWVNIGDPKLKNETKIHHLKKILVYLNYDSRDLRAIKEILLKRIINERQNIHQKDRKVFLEDWYGYCQAWIERYLNESLLAKDLI